MAMFGLVGDPYLGFNFAKYGNRPQGVGINGTPNVISVYASGGAGKGGAG
jgi:hypothetical protein